MSQEYNGADDLVYVKYSAKDLLLTQSSRLDKLQNDVTDLRLAMRDIANASVTRVELQTTRRWAVSAAIAGTGALMVTIGLIFRAVGL